MKYTRDDLSAKVAEANELAHAIENYDDENPTPEEKGVYESMLTEFAFTLDELKNIVVNLE